MKREIPVPAIIAAIAVVVAIVGYFGYHSIVQPKPAHVKGGIHVSPPGRATTGPPTRGYNGTPGAPQTGGGGN